MDKMINQVVGANYNNPVLDSRLSVFSVAIPIRVSSDEQAQPDKISLEQQEKDAIDYCHKQEWQVYRVYRDVCSGSIPMEEASY